jgi:hypothetical protein
MASLAQNPDGSITSAGAINKGIFERCKSNLLLWFEQYASTKYGMFPEIDNILDRFKSDLLATELGGGSVQNTTYTVTITEPGAEPVTVSLEWTADAPKVAGMYALELNRGKDRIWLEVVPDEDDDDTLCVDVGGPTPEPLSLYDGDLIMCGGRRWLGPLPMPPSGE